MSPEEARSLGVSLISAAREAELWLEEQERGAEKERESEGEAREKWEAEWEAKRLGSTDTAMPTGVK
jgi:hypothetical protein